MKLAKFSCLKFVKIFIIITSPLSTLEKGHGHSFDNIQRCLTLTLAEIVHAKFSLQ